jgi:dephospho-CoA kinase
LTGPIGCGKSTIAAWLGELGAVVIDADVVARQATAPGAPTLGPIAERFGPAVMRADGSLDRAALGRIVFADPLALAALEAIVHPAVRPLILAEMDAAERAGAAAVVVEAIKLVEGGLAQLCDEVWFVTCSASAQRLRVSAREAARGTDAADASLRIAAQADLSDRIRPSATRVMETSGPPEETRSAVEDAYDAALGNAPS